MKQIKEYYDNARIKSFHWVNEKNKTVGECKIWYDNGQLWVHCFYDNGLLQGESKYWDSKNKLIIHSFYYKDNRIDISKYVSDKNNISEEERFILKLTFDGYFPIITHDGT